MGTQDKCVTILPYFKIHDGKAEAFKAICEQMVERSGKEPKCLYYGFSFAGNEAHCREGYEDAGALLAHFKNIGFLLPELLKISDVIRTEIHGPAAELAKLRRPLAQLNAQFFTLEYGFRR